MSFPINGFKGFMKRNAMLSILMFKYTLECCLKESMLDKRKCHAIAIIYFYIYPNMHKEMNMHRE